MMRCDYAGLCLTWYLIFNEISVFLFGIIDICTVPMFGCHWIVTLIKERLAVKQLQFACEQAFPAALHWQLTIFIRSGGAGGPLAITGDGTLLSHTQPNSVIQSDVAFCLSTCLPQ